MEKGLSKNVILSALTRSPHGKLDDYVPVASQAAREEPEFLAHLISYDRDRGQIRDCKVALPVISLKIPEFREPEFVENSLAHLALLPPRDFERAFRFAKSLKLDGRMRSIRRLTERYLRSREENPAYFDRTVAQFRINVKALYRLIHLKPSEYAQKTLYDKQYRRGSVLETLKALPLMEPKEAAGAILEHKIPFLTIQAALRKKAKDPIIVMAMMDRMSPSEIQTNLTFLERFGVKDYPETRAALENALARLAGSKKTVLKTSHKATEVKDEGLKAKLHAVQEKQLNNLKGAEGDWLVLADKSGSMQHAIETARHVAAVLARAAKGNVHLVFFDTAPRYIDVTGKTLEEIQTVTRHIAANGGTSIGCGVLDALSRNANIDGIAIVSDAKENTAPFFTDQYTALCQSAGKSIPVYLYRLTSNDPSMDLADRMKQAGLDMQEFDLRGGVDYYSLPQLVATMRTNRYSLLQEVLDTKLLSLEDVFQGTGKEVAILCSNS